MPRCSQSESAAFAAGPVVQHHFPCHRLGPLAQTANAGRLGPAAAAVGTEEMAVEGAADAEAEAAAAPSAVGSCRVQLPTCPPSDLQAPVLCFGDRAGNCPGGTITSRVAGLRPGVTYSD